MVDLGLSASDWINITIAIGVALTAVFTAQTARAAKEQTRLYAPVVTVGSHKATGYPLHVLSIALIQADRERFMIAKLSVPRLRRARLIHLEERHGPGGAPKLHLSGAPTRAVRFSAAWTRPAVFVDPRGAEVAVVRVHIASRADSKVRSRRTIRISTKD